MAPPTKPQHYLALAGIFAVTLAGCSENQPSVAPAAPSAATADLSPAAPAAPSANDAAVVAAAADPSPRSRELGLLRQATPTLPAAGSTYAVADFPQHTPPLQEGTEDDRRLVEIYCVGCHSTSYISMQPPLPHDRWQAEVKKMITAYGAVVPDPIAVRIVTYLHAYYGNSPLPPRKRPGPNKNSTSDGGLPSGLDP